MLVPTNSFVHKDSCSFSSFSLSDCSISFSSGSFSHRPLRLL